MAIFYFIVAVETIKGGKLFKKRNYLRKYSILKRPLKFDEISQKQNWNYLATQKKFEDFVIFLWPSLKRNATSEKILGWPLNWKPPSLSTGMADVLPPLTAAFHLHFKGHLYLCTLLPGLWKAAGHRLNQHKYLQSSKNRI